VKTQEWDHLGAAVAALVAAGNEVVGAGFRPTQGGWKCELAAPLDPEVATALAAADARMHFSPADDELFCEHCWTTIYGAQAAARYLEAHRRAKETPTPT
jgi:hypothetical protein